MMLDPRIQDPYERFWGTRHAYRFWSDGFRYALAAINQKLMNKYMKKYLGKEYRVPEHKVQKVHDLLEQAYRVDYGQTDTAVFEQFWAELEPIIRTHRALVKFFFKKPCFHSTCYPRWVIDVVRDENYAKAMMVVVGQGYDWADRPVHIEDDDAFIDGVVWDWCLQEARYRQLHARSAMLTAQDVMIIGAGYLPEFWDGYGGTLPTGQRVLACDVDQRIPRAELEAAHPGLTYLGCDALTMLNNPDNFGQFDVVNIPGVISYNISDFDQIFDQAMKCLRPGGVLIFDLNLLHVGMMYIGLMLDWSMNSPKPITLLKKDKAIGLVRQAAERHHAEWEHSVSGHYGEKTAAMLFRVKKPQQ